MYDLRQIEQLKNQYDAAREEAKAGLLDGINEQLNVLLGLGYCYNLVEALGVVNTRKPPQVRHCKICGVAGHNKKRCKATQLTLEKALENMAIMGQSVGGPVSSY